jgi:hypothetical protein
MKDTVICPLEMQSNLNIEQVFQFEVINFGSF